MLGSRLKHKFYISIIITCCSFFNIASSMTYAFDTGISSLGLDWIDKSVNLKNDYYTYANGNWLKQNPIPASEASWGTFEELSKKNKEKIHALLEELAKTSHPEGSAEQKMADFYLSGMNESLSNKVGIEPLQAELKQIDEIHTRNDLQIAMTHLQLIGSTIPFTFVAVPSIEDSNKMIGSFDQSGLGLPSPSYYLKSEFQNIRLEYKKYIARILVLSGVNQTQAAKQAESILSLETALAKATLSETEMNDPKAIYHSVNRNQLTSLMTTFKWGIYFHQINHPEINIVNLGEPSFFKKLNQELSNRALDDWKAYLRWQLLFTFAPYLSSDFHHEYLSLQASIDGSKTISPRWLEVVRQENISLGFAVGKLYVEKTFTQSSKVAIAKIIKNIRLALENDIQNSPWMSPPTKTAAIKKLKLMNVVIGYPDKWLNYSELHIDKGPYAKNVIRANTFSIKRDLNKINQSTDRSEWYLPPQYVNAVHYDSTNTIILAAGILQPPFFDPSAPVAVNYGGIGALIGHEMTHGFDHGGAQYDGHGNLRNWWKATDLHKFHLATQCIVNQFSKYKIGNDYVNGELVVDEAVADLGGLILAWKAMHLSDGFNNAPVLANLTPEKQFFLAYAHMWAEHARPEEIQKLLLTDTHPPEKYRVNGSLANMLPFQKTYDIPENSPLVNKSRCIIW